MLFYRSIRASCCHDVVPCGARLAAPQPERAPSSRPQWAAESSTFLSWWVALVASWVLLCFMGVVVAADAPGRYLNFRRLTPADGLPAEQVLCVLEDSRGFLWFGTSDGLARYDSREFRVFRPDPKDASSLAEAAVSAIQEDTQGNLWIATSAGLDLWHRNTEHFSHFRHNPTNHASLSGDKIRSLLLDEDGSLWVGTAGAGLNHLDPSSGKCERFEKQPGQLDGLGGNTIRCLFRDRQGFLWIGTADGGLNQFDQKTGHFRVYGHNPGDPRSLSHNNVSAIAEDTEGYLWVGTENGVSRLDKERRFFDRFTANVDDPGALQAQIVSDVLVDRDGSVWVGTDAGGLSRFDAARKLFTHYRHSKYAEHTLASDVIRALFQDRSGDLWIGHYPNGVSHADRLAEPFRVFRSLPGETNTLSDDHIQPFLEDPSGDLWVGTDNGGLNHWRQATGRWTSYQHDPHDPRGVVANSVLALLRDSRGQIWVGTWEGGLNRFEPNSGTFHRYLPELGRTNSLSSPHVCGLVEDHQQQIWAATSGGGLNRYVPSEDGFVHYRYDSDDSQSLNDDFVRRLLVTRDGTFWVGTSKGMARWVPATQNWKRFQAKLGESGALSSDQIEDLLEDHEGILWVSTAGGGLNRLDPRTGRFEHFGTADGLPSDVLRGLLEDADGMLWVASNEGLARFDPRTRNIRVYDESNGLPGSQFSHHGRLRLRSGELLFGTTQGFVRFDPRMVQPNTNPPPVVLTRFEVFNEPQAPGAPGSPLKVSITETRLLQIPSRMSVISFQFAALGFHAAARTSYEYRLEGFDTAWRKAGSERRATFTNLDPGRYRFRVRAAYGDGQWSENRPGLALVIQPAWWQNWWVRGVSAWGLIAGLLATGWRIANGRARARLQEAERERERAQEGERAATRLRLALEAAHQGFYDLNVQTGEAEVSAEYATMLGYDAQGFRETNDAWIERLHPDDQQPVAAVYRDYIAGKLPEYRVEFRQRTKSGDWKWILSLGKIVERDAHGQPLRMLGTHTDITERKRAEEEKQKLQAQLTQAQKMESVGRLAGGVAHDFNNMLQAILGNASLAMDEVLPGGLAHECLGEIEKSAQRSADLTRQLLAFARKQTIAPRVLDLNDTVSRTLKMLQRLIGEDIDLVWLPRTNLWAVKIDPSQLDQILANFCVNSRDAIAGAGTVTIQTDNVTLDRKYAAGHPDFVPGDYVVLVVKDTGKGMDADTRSHLFEPFFTTKEVGKGTGLGLATVFGIVKQNHGLIHVESQLGQGTTFKVYFPRVEAEAAEEEPPPPGRGVGGTETVLLVEDEEQILNLGRRVLSQHGYTILAAATPQDALALAAEHFGPIHLLITDVVMPGMNGKALFERLHASRADLRCLFMSGYTADVIAHHGVLDEGVEFLQKPFTLQTIAHRVRKVLDAPVKK